MKPTPSKSTPSARCGDVLDALLVVIIISVGCLSNSIRGVFGYVMTSNPAIVYAHVHRLLNKICPCTYRIHSAVNIVSILCLWNIQLTLDWDRIEP